MNAVAGGEAPQSAPIEGSLPCGRCGEVLTADQDWCLRCGDPARTVIAPTPRWRRPLLALGVLTAAFLSLTDDDPPPARTITSTITTQPGDALPPGVTPAPGGASGPTGPQSVNPPTTSTTTTTTTTTVPGTTNSVIPDTEAGG